MKEIEAMTDNEVIEELAAIEPTFSKEDWNALESGLHLRAACLGWTGNPLQQPPRAVLATAREVKKGAQV